MRYQRLLKRIANENNTTPEEVENEMRKAIQEAGLEIEPSVFIALVTTKVRKTIYRK